MLWSATISAFLATNTVVAAARANNTFGALFNSTHNVTNLSVATAGVYEILRAEIYQTTVNTSASGSGILTTQESFDVIVQGVSKGALPIKCSVTWVTIYTTYPALVALICTDPAVNVTLFQGEVWPEFGGFYLFVELK